MSPEGIDLYYVHGGDGPKLAEEAMRELTTPDEGVGSHNKNTRALSS
jgi:hypothetical protein